VRACVGGEGGAGGAKDEEKLRNFFTFLITLPQAEEKFISRRRALFFCSIFLDVRGWLSRGSAACYLFN